MKPSLKPSKYVPLEDGQPTDGWGPFKYHWYSVCSAHRRWDSECPRCQAGIWVNCWEHEVEHFIYENDPTLWRWWANRPLLIPALKQLFNKLTNKNAK